MPRGGSSLVFGRIQLHSEGESLDRLHQILSEILEKEGYPEQKVRINLDDEKEEAAGDLEGDPEGEEPDESPELDEEEGGLKKGLEEEERAEEDVDEKEKMLKWVKGQTKEIVGEEQISPWMKRRRRG